MDLLHEYFNPPSSYFRSQFDPEVEEEEEEDVTSSVSPVNSSESLFDSSPYDLDLSIWEASPPQNREVVEFGEIVEEVEEVIEVVKVRKTSRTMTSSEKGPSPMCEVCASPTATTLHFGGRSCKACAAFFRRSVAMTMTYECIGSGDDSMPCKIHFELRMLCRHCRFTKCLEAGMRRELVQAKKEDNKVAKRRSRGLIVKKQEDPELTYEEYVNAYSNPQLEVHNPSQSKPELIEDFPDPYTSPTASPIPPVPSTPSSILTPLCSSSTVPRASQTPPPPFDPQQASTSYQYQLIEVDNKAFELVDHYVRTEASLNDRRKIMYTDTQIRDVFDTVCECPYERHQLKPFDYLNFCGFVKHDFVMILDYVNQFPEFQSLLKNEKNVVYRMACAVDSMLASAYYTYRAGIDKERLVLFNGDFIPMNPRPMSGDEPGAEKFFKKPSDHEKYKTLMPLKLKQYFEMAVPFSQLEVSFEEFVLLKALTIWHISNYKLLDEGRAICARQRDAIVQALHKVVEERGDEDPAIRVGQLLLSMSYITEQVQAMTSSYLLMTFFDVVSCDSIMHDLLSFKDD